MKKLKKITKPFKSIGHFAISHKIISVIIVAVLAVATVFGYRYYKFKHATSQTTTTYIRTVTLTKTTLSDSVSMTGTVESANVSTVTTSLSAAIKTINVSVGDYVEEGDIICTLDSSDIQEQIADVEASISDAQDAAQDTYDSALSKKNTAWEDCFGDDGAYAQLTQAQDDLDDAKSALNQANSDLATYINTENSANAALTTAGQNLAASSEAVLTVSDAGSTISFYVSASSEVMATADKSTYALLSTASGIGTYQLAYVNAYLTEARANTNLQSAKEAYGYSTIENNYNSALSAYNQANSNYTASYSTYSNAETALATAKEELEEGSTNQLESLNDQLATLQEELEECNLKASTSGKITSISATVGSKPNGTIATIQDTDNLIISIDVEEGDVDSLETGMTCIITSDATEGDIYGELTQISPVASTSGMGSTASTFSAEVAVNDGNNGLLIGMNANVEIIISSVDNVFSVPYDAVETDDDGTAYVYELVSGSGADAEFEKVSVTTGEETNYYIEISGDNVYEGMVIRASADADEAVTEVDDSSFSLSDLFGGGSQSGDSSGNMPSGSNSGTQMPSGGNFDNSNAGGGSPE